MIDNCVSSWVVRCLGSVLLLGLAMYASLEESHKQQAVSLTCKHLVDSARRDGERKKKYAKKKTDGLYLH